MKANLKGAGGVKNFLLAHGEKIGMALVAAVAGWLVYASMGQESEQRQPGELSQLVSSTGEHIDNDVTWEQYLNGPPESRPRMAEDWEPVANAEVPSNAYPGDAWDRPVVPPTVRRSDPKLLAAEALEGDGQTVLIAYVDPEVERRRLLEEQREADRRQFEMDERRRRQNEEDRQGRRRGRGAGRGALARGARGEFGAERGFDGGGRRMMGVNRRGGVSLTGAERIEEVSYAVVVAKAPALDQLNVYRNAFENALGYDRQRDTPLYLGYYVERAEVTPEGQSEWRRVNVRNGEDSRPLPVVTRRSIEKAMYDWPQVMPPLADPRFLHPDLTFPLPPVLYREFKREVVHSEVPLEAETEAQASRAEDAPTAQQPEGEESLFAAPDAGQGRGGAFDGTGQGGMGPTRGRPGMPGGRGVPGEFGGGDLGLRSRMPSEGGRGMRSMRSMGAGREFAVSPDVPCAMVRFFDFTVEPGKRYKYRVKLILQDPNGKGLVSLDSLDKETRARVEKQDEPTRNSPPPHLTTDWSEPSAPISVPMAGQVRVVTVSAGSTNREPSAELLVKDFDIGDDGRAMQAETMQSSIGRGEVLNIDVKDQLTMKGGARSMLEEVEEFQFHTNITVLDIGGGQKVAGETAPGRVLLMDPAGRLYVRDEMSDLEDVEMYRAIYEEDDRRDRGRGEYGDWLGGRRR